MKVTCNTKGIRMMDKGNKRAIASITLDDAFVIRNLSVVQGSKGLFVNMPSQKGLDKEGKEAYFDTAFPLSKELREDINKAVLDAYEEKLNELQKGATQRDETAHTENNNAENSAETDENEIYPF